jgi:hypothetical protein
MSQDEWVRLFTELEETLDVKLTNKASYALSLEHMNWSPHRIYIQ